MNEDFNFLESELIFEFKSFLIEVSTYNYSGDKKWTYFLKQKIAQLGLRKGYKVAVGGFADDFEKEWLYDLVWYREDLQGCLMNIPLIMESEWRKNYSEIKFDFEKLLLGNAEMRLMICQSKEKDISNLISKFKNAIDIFNQNKGNRFFFAVLNSDTEEEFIFKTYTKL